MTYSRTIILIFYGLVLSGCTTSLEVCRLGEPGTTTKCPSFLSLSEERQTNKLIGVPYQLTRTEFILTVEPPSNKTALTTYTLSQVNVPDDKKRYWVNIDPAWLTKTNFKLTFGNKGELTSTSYSAAEQVTPTIKAIGEFAVSAIAAAGGVAGKMGAAAFLPLDEGANRPEEDLYSTVQNLTKVYQLPYCEGELAAPTESLEEQRRTLLARMERVITLKTASPFYKMFAYRTKEEKCWLQTADTHLKELISKRSEVYKNAKSNLEGKIPNENHQWRAIIKEIEREILRGKEEGLIRFVKYGEGRLLKNANDELLDTWKTYVFTARGELNGVEASKKQRELLVEILKVDASAWRDRNAAFLEELIQQEERRLIESDSTTESAYLISLKKQHAFAIGAIREFDRAETLRDFLKNVPHKIVTVGPKSESSPAMSEYEIARKELESVLTVIAQKRTALVPLSPSLPKKTMVINPTIMWSDKKLNAEAVFEKVMEDDAERDTRFVVVIERGYNQ